MRSRASCRRWPARFRPLYFHCTHTVFPEGTAVEPFPGFTPEVIAQLKRASGVWSNRGANPYTRDAGSVSQQKTLSIQPGQSESLSLAGAGAVQALKVTPLGLPEDEIEQEDILRELTISMFWDGHTSPSVWAPLGNFFATSPGINAFRTLAMGCIEGKFYSYWYMPYADGAQIVFTNDGKGPRTLEAELETVELEKSAAVRLLRFNAAWHSDDFKLGAIFSGSGVVDRDNTAGFGQDAMVLCYTSAGIPFSQSLSYSTDRGRTWTRHANNPVVPNQGIDNTERDPRVFWREPTKRWVMGLHLRRGHARFFTSPNLKDWTHVSDFQHGSIHECPDLFKLSVDGDATNEKWVLYGAGFQYSVGTFDGKRFTPDVGPIRGDFGRNFYAAQTWTNAPDGRRVQIAWMAGGRYPGMPFNQQQSFPCELTLRTTTKGIRLNRFPVREIDSLYGETFTLKDKTLKPGENPLSKISGELFDIEMEIEPGDVAEFGLRLHETGVTWAGGKVSALGCTSEAEVIDGVVHLRMLVDRTSIETFANHGALSITSFFLPKEQKTGLELYAKDGDVNIRSLRVTKLKSCWTKSRIAKDTVTLVNSDNEE